MTETFDAILPYFGGKRRLAPEILDLAVGRENVPALRYLVDGFHGSLAMVLAAMSMGYRGKAMCCDTFGWNNWLAKVLSNPEWCAQLYDRIALQPFHQMAFVEACGRLKGGVGRERELGPWDGDPVAFAHDYLLASWMGRNGEAGIKKDWHREALSGFCVRWKQSGGDPAVRWAKVKESIPDWHVKLHGRTTFMCRDILKVLPKVWKAVDVRGVLIYLDPPYLRDTRTSGEYVCDVTDHTGTLMESTDFHAQLAAAVGRFTNATVAVSYERHERLEELYPSSAGWVTHGLDQTKFTANSSGKGETQTAEEVLIVRNSLAGSRHEQRKRKSARCVAG